MPANQNNAAAPAATGIDPDRPGALSIVLQGGLSPQNAVEVANNCRHWRELFPHAQIILSLSGANLLDHPGLHGAAAVMEASCDLVTASSRGLPLSPIKRDTLKPNHVNLQIGAARNGMAHAGGRYSLRIRHDAVFLDRGFLEDYASNAVLPRGQAAALGQRVLISWLYTLNPYGIERLPLHFSDWFHFGLTQDVASLWDVPEMTAADAAFYTAHEYAPGSNAAEQLFLTRLAVEQHLMLAAFRRHFPDLALDFHNDQSSRDLALAILLDNFCLCDLQAANFLFPKYQGEQSNPLKLSHCLTPRDWRALVDHRAVDPAIILSGKIAAANDPAAFEHRKRRPERYTSAQLPGTPGDSLARTRAAQRTVYAQRFAGVPAGAYTVSVAGTIGSPGVVTLAARRVADGSLLVERGVDLVDQADFAEALDLDLSGDGGAAVEVVCTAHDASSLAVTSIELAQRLDRHGCPPLPLILPGSDAEAPPHGEPHLEFITPALPPGRYLFALDAPRPAAAETRVAARRPSGEPVRSGAPMAVPANGSSGLVVPFELVRAERRGLVVRCAPADRPIKALVVAAAEPDPLTAPFPRLIPGWRFTPRDAHVRGGELVAVGPDGLLFFGPYLTLPAGSYVAQIHCRDIAGTGRAAVRITAGAGAHQLAGRTMDLRAEEETTVAIAFDVAGPFGDEVEVLVSAHAVDTITVSSVLISQTAGPGHGGARSVAPAAKAGRPQCASWRKRLGRLALRPRRAAPRHE